MRALRTKVEKLERVSGNAQLFYILWVPAGADRVAALDQLRASGKIPADVPAYCAEWKPPNHRRVLGPCPRSRLTDHQRISDDEEAILSKAVCHDLESSGVSLNTSASDDVRDRHFNKMTDRELLGIMLADLNDAFVRAHRR